MKLRMAFGLVLVLLLLSGCDRQAVFERSIPQDDVEFSRQYIDLLRDGNFEAVEGIIDPALRGAQLRYQLEQIAAFFPDDSPADIRPVGVMTDTRGDATEITVTLQYSYPDQWILVDVQQSKSDQGVMVTGINVQPTRDALENFHEFRLADKGAVHYLVLALAVVVPLLVILALVLCIRTPKLKAKWLWVLFILPGFTQLTLNWTDGSLVFTPYAVQLLGASIFANSPYTPWMLSVSVPVGAIVFLSMRRFGKLPVENHPAYVRSVDSRNRHVPKAGDVKSRKLVDITFWGGHALFAVFFLMNHFFETSDRWLLPTLFMMAGATLMLLSYYFALGRYASKHGRSGIVWGGLAFLSSPFGIWISYFMSFRIPFVELGIPRWYQKSQSALSKQRS